MLKVNELYKKKLPTQTQKNKHQNLTHYEEPEVTETTVESETKTE